MENKCNITEFVGVNPIGDTIGLVIANVDQQVLDAMKLEKSYRSIGVVGARTGAGPHIMAADEAVKATNTEIVKIELPRDTKGGAGHGSLIIFGGEDVSDVRRAVEVTLKEVDRTFGDVYANDAGHIELQYTARASYACQTAFGAEYGRAFGLIVGAPAAIGVVMADTAVKAANLIGKGLYGVDLKMVDDKAYVIEINDNPSIDHGLEDAIIGDEMYYRLLNHFEQVLETKHY